MVDCSVMFGREYMPSGDVITAYQQSKQGWVFVLKHGFDRRYNSLNPTLSQEQEV